MTRTRLPRGIRILAVVGVAAGALALPRWLLNRRYGARVHPVISAPARPVAIVFGAGLRRDGTPTLVLADRVAAAADLYRQGKAARILMSGSGQDHGRSEPQAMRRLAIALGVNPADILIDDGGTRTYETCARASAIFGIRSALLVSQRFHLPRALALCDALGVQADGAAADLHHYSARSALWWELREIPASLVTLWEASQARSALARLPAPALAAEPLPRGARGP